MRVSVAKHGTDSADKAVRDRAIRGLVAFVSRGGGGEMTKTGEDIILEEIPQAESSTYVRLEEAEMAKLWKGLYYCMFSYLYRRKLADR